MAVAKAKDKEVYLLRKEPEGYRVVKLAENEKTGPHIAAEYVLTREISGYRCNCPGFVHRNDCKHVLMPADRPKVVPKTLDEARSIVRSLIGEFKTVFREVRLPDEPYDRDASGLVSKVTIVLRGPLLNTCILTKGVWEGSLSGSGLVARLVVE
jgi:hypothetical protein